MDLRVVRTRRHIQEAFLALRAQKPMERITVKELAARAEINKATFYLHYRDIYDLYDRMEEEIIAAVMAGITHPENLILKAPTVPLLSSPLDRAELMRRYYGIRDVIVAHFDERMMHMPWQEFVTDYLVGENGAVYLVAGHDFHFCYKGEGNPERLRELCGELGIGCDIIPKVERDHITISSTYIRTLVAQGEMERANEFLGHPHTLTDTVAHGKKLGSTLGFPTVNLRFQPGVLVPAHGVYATKVWFENGESRPAVANIGVRPTVDD